MQIQLIRNATLLLEYAGHKILIDPDFARKHTRQSLAGRSPNPMLDLPLPVDEILAGVELLMISHLHIDHFDVEAQTSIPKHMPVLCQSGDRDAILDAGFHNVTTVSTAIQWDNVCITRTAGSHGLGEVGVLMGKVSGFVFESDDEPTLYWAGDTVLTDDVRHAISRYTPDAIVLHACGATWPDASGTQQLVAMNEEQALTVARDAPLATVIVTHLETLDHAPVTRLGLRKRVLEAGIDERRFKIPNDGETIHIVLETQKGS